MAAASLPHEVLAIIFCKLPEKKDRLTFLAVCPSWRLGCSISVSHLSLPWPVSPPMDNASLSIANEAAVNTGSPPTNQRRGADYSRNSEGVMGTRRANSSRRLAVQNSNCLPVKWLTAALKLFSNLSVLDLTVPVPPDALNAVALLSGLRKLSIVLRPPLFSSGASHGGGNVANFLGDGLDGSEVLQSRDDVYEAAFAKFIYSCAGLQELSLSMRACRWEHWPLLSSKLLEQLASSLRSLVSLSIGSPMFASHPIHCILGMSNLTSLAIPLDLPQPPTRGGLGDVRQPLPRLKELTLQPYNKISRERASAPRTAGSWMHGGSSDSPLLQLPSIVAALSSVCCLRLKGFNGSFFSSAEFGTNSLSTLPDPSAMQNLTMVELCSLRELEELPEALCHLPALSSIRIQDCPTLLQLPDAFGSLGGCLKRLHLHAVGLHYLPQSFSTLTSLATLSLSHLHWLEHLPAELGSLISLECLEIVSCKRILVLPENLSCLNLKSLTLSYNVFPIQPSLVASFHNLTSLTVTLRCRQDIELASALASLPCLVDFELTMADDAAGLSISGSEITSLLPLAPQLVCMKMQDLRSSCYAATFLHRDGRDQDGGDALPAAGGAAADGTGNDGVIANQLALPAAGGQAPAVDAMPYGGEYSILHFMHGPYPLFSGLKQLSLKCAWVHFTHESFPLLESLDLVVLCRSKEGTTVINRTPGESGLVQVGCLQSLVSEVFLCSCLKSFVLFTPGAPDVLSAPRGPGSYKAFQSALPSLDSCAFPSPTRQLHTFLLNGTDMLPFL